MAHGKAVPQLKARPDPLLVLTRNQSFFVVQNLLLSGENMMLSKAVYRTVAFLVACTPLLVGCANTSPVSPPAAHADHSTHDHAGHDHAGHAGGDPEIAKALASLSAADRAAVEKQRVCPVTDEPLGSMGAPMKVSVQGHDVYICCEGCREVLQDDPNTFLAKLTR